MSERRRRGHAWERRGGNGDGGNSGGAATATAATATTATVAAMTAVVAVSMDGASPAHCESKRTCQHTRARRWLPCTHVGRQGRAHLCARRRSCRGRWLPTGRSEPRPPEGWDGVQGGDSRHLCCKRGATTASPSAPQVEFSSPARAHVLVIRQTRAQTSHYPTTTTGMCGARWDVLESKRASPGSLNRCGAQPARQLQRRRRQSSLPLPMPKLGTAAGWNRAPARGSHGRRPDSNVGNLEQQQLCSTTNTARASSGIDTYEAGAAASACLKVHSTLSGGGSTNRFSCSACRRAASRGPCHPILVTLENSHRLRKWNILISWSV